MQPKIYSIKRKSTEIKQQADPEAHMYTKHTQGCSAPQTDEAASCLCVGQDEQTAQPNIVWAELELCIYLSVTHFY